MHAKLAIFSSALLFLLTPSAQGQPAESIFPYTLQVASFPDVAFAATFAERLSRAGEPVGFGTVELPGRGHWTRVYVGSFRTPAEARQYGDGLIGRKVIDAYLVKTASELQSLGRPQTVTRKPLATDRRTPQASAAGFGPASSTPADSASAKAAAVDLFKPAAPNQTVGRLAVVSWDMAPPRAKPQPAVAVVVPAALNDKTSRPSPRQPELNQQLAVLLTPFTVLPATLPVAKDLRLRLVPIIDADAIPRPDPVYLAFNLIRENRGGHGGLWVSGDREEALARLVYVIDNQANLISLDDSGGVHINRRRLAEAAGVNQVAAEAAPMRVAEYIMANEGLLLLVQLMQGGQRYLLHIGRRAPSFGGVVEVSGGINLDNNYDSRINPYRRDGRKLDNERPPKGFDSMVAINPAARWFNLRANEFVPAGQITFHELAEAHAKVVLSLDYLQEGGCPGAHDVALEREERLRRQRPTANLVLTLGANRLFKSEEEVRNFYAQTGNAGHQR